MCNFIAQNNETNFFENDNLGIEKGNKFLLNFISLIIKNFVPLIVVLERKGKGMRKEWG